MFSFTNTCGIQPAGDGCSVWSKLPSHEQLFCSCRETGNYPFFLEGCLDSSSQNSFISCPFPKALAICWCVNPGFVITLTDKRSELALFLNLATLLRAGDKGERDGDASWLWKLNVFVQKAQFWKPLSFLDTICKKSAPAIARMKQNNLIPN